MHIDQRDKDKEPVSKAEKIFLVLISLVFLFMMSMEVVTNYEPKKLGALLFVLFWIPLLVIHEFGHAIMAKLLGWKVKRIVLGFGKVLGQSRLLGAPIEIRTIPLEGFVEIAPTKIELARLKHALIYFAGPGIELLVCFIIIQLLGGVDELFTISNDYYRIALQSFAYAALAGAIINLIPIGIITNDGSAPNDGLGILLCLFSSALDYERWIRDESVSASEKDQRNRERPQRKNIKN